MASMEALDYLIAGEDAWTEYTDKAEGVIDLTFAELSEKDLRNRSFKNCDLSGSQLLQANLDGATFIKSNLSGVQLMYSSLIRCVFDKIVALRTDFSKAIIRNSTFTGVRFSSTNFVGTSLEDCEFELCQLLSTCFDDARFERDRFRNVDFENTHGSNWHLIRCTFLNQGTFSEIMLDDSKIINCSFNNVRLINSKMTAGEFINCEMIHCNIDHFVVETTVVNRLDLSFSTVKRVDVRSLDPSTTTLLNTAFVDCKWPKQAGQVTLTGMYIKSPFLIAQPVQDVFGISPTLRREIGDAQYITSMLNQANGLTKELLYRIWGLTSSFGQSLTRLTIFSSLVVLIHTLLFRFLAIHSDMSSIFHLLGANLHGLSVPDFWMTTSDSLSRVHINTVLTDFVNIGQIFLGLNAAIGETSNSYQNVVLVSVRISGLLALGLWITIASSQINKLSSV